MFLESYSQATSRCIFTSGSESVTVSGPLHSLMWRARSGRGISLKQFLHSALDINANYFASDGRGARSNSSRKGIILNSVFAPPEALCYCTPCVNLSFMGYNWKLPPSISTCWKIIKVIKIYYMWLFSFHTNCFVHKPSPWAVFHFRKNWFEQAGDLKCKSVLYIILCDRQNTGLIRGCVRERKSKITSEWLRFSGIKRSFSPDQPACVAGPVLV